MNEQLLALLPQLEASALALQAEFHEAHTAVQLADAHRSELKDRLYFLERLIEAAKNVIGGSSYGVPL